MNEHGVSENRLANTILFLDLEAENTSSVPKIYGLGAIWGDRTPIRAASHQAVLTVLPDLRRWVDAASFVCAHNGLLHDFPILETSPLGAITPSKQIDTLLLSPLAFPRKPYHALVKEGKLVKTAKNDPVADSVVCRKVFEESIGELRRRSHEELAFYQLAFEAAELKAMAALMKIINGRGETTEVHELLPDRKYSVSDRLRSPTTNFVRQFKRLNRGRCCLENLPSIEEPDDYLAYVYIHSWLNVAGTDSVLPFWLCRRFPQIREFLHGMRARTCGKRDCPYCCEMHSPTRALQRYFGFESFRPVPAVPGEPEVSLQERIVATGMQGKSSLSVLPTGGGKSICFQIPALTRYESTGALSIVISPLQSLMKDQVENLRTRVGILHCNALYGLLTPLERKSCLSDIALGSVGLIYVAPEQLRSPAFRKAILNREIAFWIYDEAHCLSKWGHDFRPDYLYGATYIRELAQDQGAELPTIMCLTATAKQDVKNDIMDHFKKELGTEMILLDGGTDRKNLNYQIEKVPAPSKFERIVEILTEYYGEIPDFTDRGSVVIFAATRRNTEEIAGRLQQQGWNAKYFHAGLEVDQKKAILESFLDGTLKIIVSTNAFGMGVDKPDIRYVIHVDAPGSLENYLQEAGRAGRDGEPAECILLFDDKDLEIQHSFVARSKITQRDIDIIWKAIRTARPDKHGAIVLTVDEILSRKSADYISFDHEHASSRKTKVHTGIALLENREFLERKENRSRVFQATPIAQNIEEAQAKINNLNLSKEQKKLWGAIMRQFFELPDCQCSDINEFAQLDEMRAEFERIKKQDQRITSINSVVFRVLNEMAQPSVRLLKKDVHFTAMVKSGNRGHSASQNFKNLSQLEQNFIEVLQVEVPDAEGEHWLDLRRANEVLCREGLRSHVQTLWKTVKYLRDDWTKLKRGVPRVEIKQSTATQVQLRLRCEWSEILELSRIRRDLSALILELLREKTDKKSEVLVSFNESELIDRVVNDFSRLDSQVAELSEALHHALLWMHDGKVIELQQGKALITSAMTLYLKDAKKRKQARRFTKGDYEPLARHYQEKILQVNIIGEYAQKGFRMIGAHLEFIKDYFRLEGKAFIDKHFPENPQYLEIATGKESYQEIFESLGNPKQQAIVGEKEEKNLLVLAGPGSGKTRVIVHRCAWLLRVARVPASGIVILCFNRLAALQIRRRLWKLVDKDASGVTILTFHGLALKLLGRSLAELDSQDSTGRLNLTNLIPEAIELLQSKKIPIGMDADEFRNRLTGSMTHLLIDEYQDINEESYTLVSLLAGKGRESNAEKLNLMVVGDDDQCIYEFSKADTKYIRRYEEDYGAGDAPHAKKKKHTPQVQRYYLVENYRSTQNIIAVSNRLISNNRDRMKVDYPIVINRDRLNELPGGVLESLDHPVTRGKISLIRVNSPLHQAQACAEEIKRLKRLLPDRPWQDFSVLARNNQELNLVQLLLEDAGIPSINTGEEGMPKLRRVRLMDRWMQRLQEKEGEEWNGEQLQQALKAYLQDQLSNEQRSSNHFAAMLEQIASSYFGETEGSKQPVSHIRSFFNEMMAEKDMRIKPNVVQLTTVHKAKGLEFRHVLILGEHWKKGEPSSKAREGERRVFYVAMTRAIQSLTLFQMAGKDHPFLDELSGPEIIRRTIATNNQGQKWVGIACEEISLKDLFIDFAGRLPEGNPSLDAIERLRTGDQLKLTSNVWGNGCCLTNQDGVVVASLSNKGRKTWEPRKNQIAKIELLGVHVRRKTDQKRPEYLGNLQRDTWGIPICKVYYYKGRL